MHKLQEICQRPKFIAEGASRFDVEQGEQGDPWLLAAVSSLTLTPKFLDRVVPPDQNFEHGYCGINIPLRILLHAKFPLFIH